MTSIVSDKNVAPKQPSIHYLTAETTRSSNEKQARVGGRKRDELLLRPGLIPVLDGGDGRLHLGRQSSDRTRMPPLSHPSTTSAITSDPSAAKKMEATAAMEGRNIPVVVRDVGGTMTEGKSVGVGTGGTGTGTTAMNGRLPNGTPAGPITVPTGVGRTGTTTNNNRETFSESRGPGSSRLVRQHSRSALRKQLSNSNLLAKPDGESSSSTTATTTTPKSKLRIYRLVATQSWSTLHSYIAHPTDPTGLNEAIRYGLVTDKTHGRTALHWACDLRAPKDVVQLLVESCSFAVALSDSMGRTPLHLALRNYVDTGVVKLLLEKYSPAASMVDADGKTPLILICENYNQILENKKEAVKERLIRRRSRRELEELGKLKAASSKAEGVKTEDGGNAPSTVAARGGDGEDSRSRGDEMSGSRRRMRRGAVQPPPPGQSLLSAENTKKPFVNDTDTTAEEERKSADKDDDKKKEEEDRLLDEKAEESALHSILSTAKALISAAPLSVNIEDEDGMSALEHAIVVDAEIDLVKYLMDSSKEAWTKEKLIKQSSQRNLMANNNKKVDQDCMSAAPAKVMSASSLGGRGGGGGAAAPPGGRAGGGNTAVVDPMKAAKAAVAGMKQQPHHGELKPSHRPRVQPLSISQQPPVAITSPRLSQANGSAQRRKPKGTTARVA